jgi:hypothetical protein
VAPSWQQDVLRLVAWRERRCVGKSVSRPANRSTDMSKHHVPSRRSRRHLLPIASAIALTAFAAGAALAERASELPAPASASASIFALR